MAIQALQNRARGMAIITPGNIINGTVQRPSVTHALVARAEALPSDPFQGAEIERILNLPTIHPITKEEVEAISREQVRAEYFDSGFRLFDVQAEGLFHYTQFGGLFGPIGVGWGKTFLTLLIAKAATTKGLTKILLLVPPEILSQLVNTDIPAARARFGLNYPIHVLGGRPMDYRRKLCMSGHKGLYIMPMSLLQTKDTSDNLKAIAPELVIIDEVHRLANIKAARTSRVIRMLEEFHPEMVGVSGTITKHSIMDYWHLIRPCLKENNPLPNSKMMAYDWAVLIDAEASTENAQAKPSGGLNAIAPLVAWAGKHFPNTKGGFPQDVYGFRRAFQSRLNSAPGVVASGDAEIGTSLLLCNQPIKDYDKHPDWLKLKDLIDGVQDRWITPNGDEIEHAIHKWKWLNELSLGFYNELSWPSPEKFAERRRIDLEKATEMLEHSKIQHEAQQEYARELRSWIEAKAKPGLDTPMLIGLEMARNGPAIVGNKLFKLWKDARDLCFEGMPERDSRAVRVCDYKIRAMVDWAKKLIHEKPGAGAIVWVHHQEIGKWAVDALRAEKIETIHCPAGENDRILDPLNADKIIVASYIAHGTGKNLQHFQEQYFLQWPRDARTAEQTLGRTHRNGQKADELIVYTNQTLWFDRIQFAACLNNALYIHQSTGNRQKLIYANYFPLPEIFPQSVLMQQGLDDVTPLTKEQTQMLIDKFGDFSKDAA